MVISEDEEGEKYPTNGLEVVCEVDGEDAEPFEEFDRLREGDDGAENGEDENPEPILDAWGDLHFSSVQGKIDESEEASAEHFIVSDDEVVCFFDVKVVKDREEGGKEG